MEKRYKRIDIDYEVAQLIDRKRLNPAEDVNTILRRMLGLPVDEDFTGSGYLDKGDLIIRGVKFKHGTVLKAKYGKGEPWVRVLNGKFCWCGHSFKYPSPLAEVMTGRVTDGWDFFQEKNATTGKWEPIKKRRPKVAKRSPYTQ
jgi:hypothetical protein